MIKLRILATIYYKNKNKFKKEYKKLGLHWAEDTKIGNVWVNDDYSSYLRKLPEDGNWKRFYASNCQGMVDFLIGIGAEDISNEEFEDVVTKPVYEPFPDSRVKFEKMLEKVGDNFRCFYGDTLEYANVSPEFKVGWRKLQRKYADYTFNDFIVEIRAKNKKSIDDDEVVEIRRKVDDDILPKTGRKTKKEKIKKAEIKPVVEFKKKVFKVKIKKKD